MISGVHRDANEICAVLKSVPNLKALKDITINTAYITFKNRRIRCEECIKILFATSTKDDAFLSSYVRRHNALRIIYYCVMVPAGNTTDDIKA